MLCASCGYTSANDASFCSMCGEPLTPTMGPLSLGAVACSFCSYLNEDNAMFCRACGRQLQTTVKYREKERDETIAMITAKETGREIDERLAQSRHESLLARLDRLERDIVSRLDEKPLRDNDAEPSNWEDKEDHLATMSSTLDDLIADLIDAEVNEYESPDFVHPNERVIRAEGWNRQPPPLKEKEPRGWRWLVDVLVVIALVVAVFLVGMTAGIWGVYGLGF